MCVRGDGGRTARGTGVVPRGGPGSYRAGDRGRTAPGTGVVQRGGRESYRAGERGRNQLSARVHDQSTDYIYARTTTWSHITARSSYYGEIARSDFQAARQWRVLLSYRPDLVVWCECITVGVHQHYQNKGDCQLTRAHSRQLVFYL